MTAAHDTILGLEKALLDPDTRHNAEWLDGVLDVDMTEIGKSGYTYGRDEIIGALVAERPAAATRFEVTAPVFRQLAEGLILLTYRLEPLTEGDASLRSSIWRLTGGQWRMVFHQGTRAA